MWPSLMWSIKRMTCLHNTLSSCWPHLTCPLSSQWQCQEVWNICSVLACWCGFVVIFVFLNDSAFHSQQVQILREQASQEELLLCLRVTVAKGMLLLYFLNMVSNYLHVMFRMHCLSGNYSDCACTPVWEGVPQYGRVCPSVGGCAPVCGRVFPSVWESVPPCGRVFPSVPNV